MQNYHMLAKYLNFKTPQNSSMNILKINPSYDFLNGHVLTDWRLFYGNLVSLHNPKTFLSYLLYTNMYIIEL